MSEPGQPAGWVLAPLKDIADVNPASLGRVPDDDEQVSFVPMSAVAEKARGIRPHLTRPWREVRKGYTRFRDGDVIFAKITPCMENGKTALCTGLTGGVGAGSTEFHVVRPVAPELGSYLTHFFGQLAFRRLARANMTGTAGQLRVPTRFFDDVAVPLAPETERNRIAQSVDSYLSRLDAAEADLARSQRNLDRFRASVLQAAVEGRLVPTEAELARAEGRAYEPASELRARILCERRRRWEESDRRGRYKEPVAPDVSVLPMLPDGWCWATVDQLADSIIDGPFGSNLKTEHYTSAGPRVIRLQNIGDGVFRDEPAHVSPEHFAHLWRHEACGGDIVVASLGDELPRAAEVPNWLGRAIVKADCLRVRVAADMQGARYLLYALNAKPTRERATDLVHGLGRPRLGLAMLRTVTIPLPPIQEQLRAVQAIETYLSSAHAANTSLVRCAAEVDTLRRGVLSLAFAGRLVDQDPSDEPASALLDRIRTERAATAATKQSRSAPQPKRKKVNE